jgi:phosphoesterase RecJ-like protein
LRSRIEEVNVAELAGRFGGGGHPRAAGCRLDPGDAARERFLDDIAAQLGPVTEPLAAARDGHVAR